MDSGRVVITDSTLSGEGGDDILRAAGLRVERAQCATPEQVIAAGRSARALIVQWAPVTADVLAELPALRFISRLGIGYDMIDVDAATRHGVAVANTPSYCIEEVATHTVAMMLAMSRGLMAYDRSVRDGRWSATDLSPLPSRPSQTVVAIVGFGRIGSLTARHCANLGYRVLVNDPLVATDAIERAGLTPASLDEVLRDADVISLHAPLTDRTRHMLNRETLSRARRSPIIVNTCRGALVDERALVEALEAGLVSGAALDVYENEPLAATSPLRDRDDVLLTPHAAWFSPQAMADLPVHAARNVVDFLAGDPVPSIVNPEYTRQRDEQQVEQ